MVQVKDNKIISYFLPTTGILSNGRTVSGYNLLDKETLKNEGWLPLKDIKPEYNSKTHYLQVDKYDIKTDRVIKSYIIAEIPPEEQDFADRLLSLEKMLCKIPGLITRLEAIEKHLNI